MITLHYNLFVHTYNCNVSHLWPCVRQAQDVAEIVCDVHVKTTSKVTRLADPMVV